MKPHHYKKQISLSTIFSLFVAAIFLITLIFFSIRINDIKETAIIEQLQQNSSIIDTSFSEMLDYNNHIMSYMADQIVQNGTEPHYIYGLLKSFKAATETVLPWSTFTWMNDKNLLVVTSNKGIMENPADMSKRDYAPEARNEPFKIHFGVPVIGSTSKLWIIPAGFGVTDNHGKFVGAIVTGFTIDDFTKRLEHKINNKGVNFILLSNDRKIITESEAIKSNTLLLNNMVSLLPNNLTAGQSGPLSAPSLLRQNTPFAYYQVTSKYPYVFITIYDQKLSNTLIDKAIAEFILQYLVIAVLVILLLYVIRKLLVAPVLTLAAIADNITKGKLDVEIPRFYSEEVSSLGEQLQNITENKKELNVAHEQIKQANESLEEKVASRTQELQNALIVKNEFLNNVSHELRTPIHGIIAFTSILHEDWESFDDAKRREIIADLYGSTDRLYSLLNNLLDLTKFNEGKMILHLEPNNLGDIVNDVVRDCKSLLEEKSLKLELTVLSENISGNFDKQRIMQVVRNLFINAIKYSDSGVINIILRRENSKLSFSIRDQGIGIPPEENEHIFTPFTQSSQTKTGAGGTGLGLTICRQIITAHGGVIWVENNKDMPGCMFTFTIPV